MKKGELLKFDFSRKRLKARAEILYGEGNYVSALQFARLAEKEYGADGDTFALISDIYESMGLYTSSINNLFHFMDRAAPEDLPDIYEALARAYFQIGNEGQSAYYYNLLLDADDDVSDDYKAEVIDMFADKKQSSRFRFVYPPKLADYSKELSEGGAKLKNGDMQGAISSLLKVPKGAKQYENAREMQAVATLLSGDDKGAEEVCLSMLEENPNSIQALATLSAIYTEQGRTEQSKAIAKRLVSMRPSTTEEKYKIATVCCENDMHKDAFRLFKELEPSLPYDGNLLFFKAAAAVNCAEFQEALNTFSKLCVLYPDAAVAAYYKNIVADFLDEKTQQTPQMSYFYRVPNAEREARCRALASLAASPKDEARALAPMYHSEQYFSWCFDEMDGMEQDLQYLGVMAAEHAGADEFLRDVLLDCDVKDALKVELLRLLYLRGKDDFFGVVICHIYRPIEIISPAIGVENKELFLAAYARACSRFCVINELYGEKLQDACEDLYYQFKRLQLWEYAKKEENLACLMYLSAGLKDVGKTLDKVAPVFGADKEQVQTVLDLLKNAKTEG